MKRRRKKKQSEIYLEAELRMIRAMEDMDDEEIDSVNPMDYLKSTSESEYETSESSEEVDERTMLERKVKKLCHDDRDCDYRSMIQMARGYMELDEENVYEGVKLIENNATQPCVALELNGMRYNNVELLFEAISYNSSIKELRIVSCGMWNEYLGYELGHALKENEDLVRLELDIPGMCDHQAIKFCEALGKIKNHRSLTSLAFSARNCLTPSAALSVANALKDNTALVRLDLSLCHQGEQQDKKTLEQLSQALMQNTTLTDIRVFRGDDS